MATSQSMSQAQLAMRQLSASFTVVAFAISNVAPRGALRSLTAEESNNCQECRRLRACWHGSRNGAHTADGTSREVRLHEAHTMLTESRSRLTGGRRNLRQVEFQDWGQEKENYEWVGSGERSGRGESDEEEGWLQETGTLVPQHTRR